MFTKAGAQRVRITKVDITTAKYSKMDDAYAFCFRVVNPENEGEIDDVFIDVSAQEYGRGTMSNLTQYEIAKTKLGQMGCEVGELYDPEEIQRVAAFFPGKDAVVMFEEDEYNGKKRIEAKYFETRRTHTQLSKDELFAKIAKQKAALCASDGQSQAAVNSTPRQTAPPPFVSGGSNPFVKS